MHKKYISFKVNFKTLVNSVHVNINNIFMRCNYSFQNKRNLGGERVLFILLQISLMSDITKHIWFCIHCCDITYHIATGKLHCVLVRKWKS